MKKVSVLFAAVMLAACGSDKAPLEADNAATANNDKAVVEQSNTAATTNDAYDVKKVSYALGYLGAEQLRNSMDDLDMDAFLDGLSQGIQNVSEDELSMTAEEMEEAIGAYQQVKMEEMMAEQQEQMAAAQELAEEGLNFLEENAKKDGVTTLENGLQYEVLEEGDGDTKPTLENRVTTHYHGTLVDGTVFDSSVDRGEPVTFPLGDVIEGWQEALQLMTVGDKWRIVLPPELAYGEHGTGAIGPNSVLVFEVELLEIDGGDDNE